MCTSCKSNCIKGKSCIFFISTHFTYCTFCSKYFLFCRTAQKEKIQREKEETKKERAQQFPSAMTTTAATHALPTPTLPSPVTPAQATPLSSPQVAPQSTKSTPQAVGIFAVQPSSLKLLTLQNVDDMLHLQVLLQQLIV